MVCLRYYVRMAIRAWERGDNGRLARVAGYVAQRAVRDMYENRDRPSKRSRPESSSMDHLTLNSEVPARVTYRRRAESRRHRRRRLREKAQHVREDLAQVAPQRFVKYSRVTMAPTAGAQTLVFLAPMYSFYGTADTYDHLAEMATTLDIDLSISLINTIPSGDAAARKLYFNSCRMTCEIVNLQTSLSAYVTIYEYVCKKSVGFPDMNQLFSNQQSWGLGPGFPATTLNATPWDYEEVMGKIIITKKTEILMAPNSTQEYEMNDTKNKMFDGKNFDALASAANYNVGLAGWTRGLIVGVAGPASSGSNATALPTGVVFLSTFRYSVKLLLDESAIPSTAQLF